MIHLNSSPHHSRCVELALEIRINSKERLEQTLGFVFGFVSIDWQRTLVVILKMTFTDFNASYFNKNAAESSFHVDVIVLHTSAAVSVEGELISLKCSLHFFDSLS